MPSVFVFTIDQVASRRGADQVPALLETLAQFDAVIPFSRTVGDEVQGVVDNSKIAADISRLLMAENNWHIGIGIGALKPEDRGLERSADGTSPSFALARDAVEAAKRKPGRGQIAVRAAESGHPQPAAERLEALLGLLNGVIVARTPSQWKVINAVSTDGETTQAQVAEEVGMTQQGVAKSLAASLWRQELEALPLLEHLFTEAANLKTH